MNLYSLIVWFFATFSFNTANNYANNSSVKITVENLESNAGHVLVSLFSAEEGFPDKPEKAVRKASISIKDKKAWVVFTGLTAGTYAVAILHDENDDQKMNTNFFGIPIEGYGFSNDVMGRFGPPSFTKASFLIGNGSKEITILTKN
jgi:uncharacterized protein (DUF2141 family)